jgi:hypothetical protein
LAVEFGAPGFAALLVEEFAPAPAVPQGVLFIRFFE